MERPINYSSYRKSTLCIPIVPLIKRRREVSCLWATVHQCTIILDEMVNIMEHYTVHVRKSFLSL
jgi:hypothetical protein